MSHEHPYKRPCTEIPEGVCLRPVVHGDDEHLAGFHIGHERAGGYDPEIHAFERCEGYVNVDPDDPSPRWEMTGSLEGGDLTLSPSILCSDGFHGFIQNGKWVPA